MMIALVATLGLTNLNAQEFNLGISAGLPIGDAGDIATFSAIVDANYLFDVSEKFQAGPMASLSYSFGDEIEGSVEGFDVSIELDDPIFLPIGGAARYQASEDFTLGLDLGYALGLTDGLDGGFYYAPKVQYGVTETLDIVAAYRGISVDGGSFDIISLGVEFGL